MSKSVMQRPSYQEQADRMTWLARKCMYNELKRLGEAIHGNPKQPHVARRPAARVGRKQAS